jgi:hypothetical protein
LTKQTLTRVSVGLLLTELPATFLLQSHLLELELDKPGFLRVAFGVFDKRPHLLLVPLYFLLLPPPGYSLLGVPAVPSARMSFPIFLRNSDLYLVPRHQGLLSPEKPSLNAACTSSATEGWPHSSITCMSLCISVHPPRSHHLF